MTVQVADKIEYKGKSYPCIVGSMPKKHALIEKISGPKFVSANCWRGFIAQWSVSDEKLYLNSVEGNFNKLTDEPIFADWFSGVLTIGMGRGMSAVVGYKKYEIEVTLTVKDGVIDSTVEKDDTSEFARLEKSFVKTRIEFNKIKKELEEEHGNNVFSLSRKERVKKFLSSDD